MFTYRYDGSVHRVQWHHHDATGLIFKLLCMRDTRFLRLLNETEAFSKENVVNCLACMAGDKVI